MVLIDIMKNRRQRAKSPRDLWFMISYKHKPSIWLMCCRRLSARMCMSSLSSPLLKGRNMRSTSTRTHNNIRDERMHYYIRNEKSKNQPNKNSLFWMLHCSVSIGACLRNIQPSGDTSSMAYCMNCNRSPTPQTKEHEDEDDDEKRRFCVFLLSFFVLNKLVPKTNKQIFTFCFHIWWTVQPINS